MVGDGVDVVGQRERDHVRLQTIDHRARLGPGAAVALLDVQVLAGAVLPELDVGGVYRLVELAGRVVADVEQGDRLAGGPRRGREDGRCGQRSRAAGGGAEQGAAAGGDDETVLAHEATSGHARRTPRPSFVRISHIKPSDAMGIREILIGRGQGLNAAPDNPVQWCQGVSRSTPLSVPTRASSARSRNRPCSTTPVTLFSASASSEGSSMAPQTTS